MEMTKQNMFQSVEDMGRIWIDMMAAKYGVRKVEVSMDVGKAGEQPLGMQLSPEPFLVDFDFSILADMQLGIKQDVGASSYWSEIANMQTLDNLLMNHQITLKQYLERVPGGYISKKQELLDDIAAMSAPDVNGMGTGMSKNLTSDQMNVTGGSGNGALQRALRREGV